MQLCVFLKRERTETFFTVVREKCVNVSSVAMSAGDCFIGLFYLKGGRGADLPVGL